MSSKRPRPPKYRHYKPKNLGVVRINGRDHYLGRYDSPESYDRLVAEWLLTRQHGNAAPPTTWMTPYSEYTSDDLPKVPGNPATVTELIKTLGISVVVAQVLGDLRSAARPEIL